MSDNGNVHATLLGWNGGAVTLSALKTGGATLAAISKVERDPDRRTDQGDRGSLRDQHAPALQLVYEATDLTAGQHSIINRGPSPVAVDAIVAQ